MKTAVKFLMAFALFLILSSLTSCKKDKNTDPNQKKSSGTIGVGVGPVYVQFSWGDPNVGIISGGGYYYGTNTPNEGDFIGYIREAPGGGSTPSINIYAEDGKTVLCIVNTSEMFYKDAQRFLAIARSVTYPPMRMVSIHRSGTSYKINW